MASNVIERLLVNEIKETMNSPLFQTNTFSLNDSSTFYVTSDPGTTITLTNVPLANDGVVTVTFISPNGKMSIPTTLNVNGSGAGIKWQGGTLPSQSSGTVQLITLSIITVSNSVASVIGGKSYYS